MALFLSTFLVLAGCDGGGADSKDTGTPEDTSQGDSETGTEDSDTGETPLFNATGSVIDFNGAALGGARIQFCDLLCYTATSEADGSFLVEGVKAGNYKIDVDGFDIGAEYGYGRYPAGAVTDADVTLAWPAMVPAAGETKTITNGSYSFAGGVTWTIDSSIIDLPLGYDAYDFTVGVTDGAMLTAYWEQDPAFAVTFLPFASEIAGSFDLSVSGSWPDGNYDVYQVGTHGELEPIGSAVSVGGSVTGLGLTPEILTWVVFVPAE